MTDPKKRTIKSFAVLIAGFVAFAILWKNVTYVPTGADTSRAFRQTLELNGRLWKSLFRKNAKHECKPPPKGKKPRVNGDIGIVDIDPATWKMEVIEDIKNPASRHVTVTMKDIQALPRTDTATEFRCIEGWSEEMAYAGVKFSDFIKAYNLNEKPYVGLVTVDGEYYVSLDIESMLHEQTILAYEMNGEELSVDNGAPLRLMIPIKYGIKSLKQIGKIYFSDERPPDYWAERGYDWYAGL